MNTLPLSRNDNSHSQSAAMRMMKPILQTINRTPHVWKQTNNSNNRSSNLCDIKPSFILFQELQNGTPFDLTQVQLESFHDRKCEHDPQDTSSDDDDDDDNSYTSRGSKLPQLVSYYHTHVLKYKGETVCVFQTCHHVNAHGTWGQSMTLRCRPQAGELQAHIVHKGRTATGNGWNAHERVTYRVLDILEAAAERYSQNQGPLGLVVSSAQQAASSNKAVIMIHGIYNDLGAWRRWMLRSILE